LAASLGTNGIAHAAERSPEVAARPKPARAKTDRLLVRFRSVSSQHGIDAALAAAGAEFVKHVGQTGFSVVAPTAGHSRESVRAALAVSGAVGTVEVDGVRFASDVVPNDLQPSQSGYLRLAGFPSAWELTTGSDDLVLVILDSGVAFGHPDLQGRHLPGRDIVNNDGDPTDDLGHGTNVAQVAGAFTNNSRGVAGATWKGRILPVKVIDGEGLAVDADIAAGITWAVDNGADVINLSLGGPGASAALQSAVDYATANNVVVVAAAGNTSSNEPHFPAASKGVLAVGAVDSGGGLASFSNFGSWIDLVAPGVNILTSEPGAARTLFYGNSGTSFSTPLVAGAALLVRAVDRSASAATVVDRLRRSATDVGAPGFDPLYGAGILNAGAAVRLSPGFSAAGAQPSPGGYWMLSADGGVYPFGAAPYAGEANLGAGDAADLEPTPAGSGYWVVNESGAVYGFGAPYFGGLPAGALAPGEQVTSLSSTLSGQGYWIFTTAGRVFPFGDATFFGDMRGVPLNGAVLDSIPTASGRGYYMVAADGGIFSFGDAAFYGSMGGIRLNAPVRSLVPDPDGVGYWLVAEDGGTFSFEAPFRGSMGGATLNAPVTGMVAFGDGYLMVATDGGIFNFSNKAFAGSLGADPPGSEVVAVATAG
jgi:hypothetical protein